MKSQEDKDMPLTDRKDEIMDCDETMAPDEPKVSSVENTFQQSAWITHAKPLVHRPARNGGPTNENTSIQLSEVAHANPLVIWPAVPEVTVEQSSTIQQPSTLQQPHIIQQPSRIRPSYSNLRRMQRQYREHKRRQAHEKMERHKGNRRPARVEPPKEHLEQSDTEEGNLRMELQVAKRYVGWHEKKTAGLFDNIDLELKPFDIVEGKLATEVVLLRIKEIEVMEDVRKLLVEQAMLEAWQEWGRKLMDTFDKERRRGEKKEEQRRGLDWRSDKDWDKAIDQAFEAIVNKRLWEEAMKESMGNAMEEAREREKARVRAKDRAARMRDKTSGRTKWHVEPEVDSDDMLADFPLNIDDSEAEGMDMDSPVDMKRRIQEVKLGIPKS
ncbi:hypothetical protein EAF04_005494 [Stromatinia cepivora]|nr:hypothetical protein EAF04_005494 [Stromatinia cepivora]